MDASGVAGRIEQMLPIGARPRQLSTHTLLVGMLAIASDHRPAHLMRVHAALVGLPEGDRTRLGVVANWKTGPHGLTYRQVERTFGLIAHALAKPSPDGAPAKMLSQVIDALVEASVPAKYKEASTALAVDWTDLETFSRPPSQKGGECADMEAAWGHRRGDGPGQKDGCFFGYYAQAATMVNEEGGPPVPEFARRIGVSSCNLDPPRVFVPVLQAMVSSGVAIGDVLADSGYAYRVPEAWAMPLRALGASIITDLHPNDRGPRGTYAGAIISNGNLYCPATPRALLELGPLGRGASEDATATHDKTSAEAARYKLGRICADDADGYHRVACPATAGKCRCPLRPASMQTSQERPEILTPPEQPPTCCAQQTITVPPGLMAKTAQKHDYPSAVHRASYARRSAAERTFSTLKDPASNDISRGWCRLMGLSAITLFISIAFVVRNERIIVSYEDRQAEDARRISVGGTPKMRRRQRKSLADLAGASANAPP